MSNNNSFKKTFFEKLVILSVFNLFKTPLTKSVKAISNINNSKTTKEQLKVE